MTSGASWILIPAMLLVPPLGLALAFEADRRKAAAYLLIVTIPILAAGMIFGWYGAFTYTAFYEALTGQSEWQSSGRVQGAGIFISWASALPIALLIGRNIEELRLGTFLDRAYLGFVVFYGMHLSAACLLIVIKSYFES